MKKLFRKLFKRRRSLWSQKVNFIVDDSLENVPMGPYVLKKLEEANFHLSKMKSIPK